MFHGQPPAGPSYAVGAPPGAAVPVTVLVILWVRALTRTHHLKLKATTPSPVSTDMVTP